MGPLDLFVIAVFTLALLIAGAKQISQTEASYLLADRKTGFFALTATLVMTEINTAILIGFSSLGYLAGFRALMLPFIFLISLLFYAFSVSKKWKDFDGLSVTDLFKQRYGKEIGLFATTSLFIVSIGFCAAYIKSIVVLFQPFFPYVSDWVMSGFFVLLMFLLSIRGGILSVICTDVVSFLVTFVFFPLMAIFSWDAANLKKPSWESLSESSDQLSASFVLSLLMLTMFTYILSPGSGQKIFAAKSKQTAFLAMVAASGIVFFLYTCAVFSAACLHARGVTLANPEHALSVVLTSHLTPGLVGLGYGVFFAASTTTIIGVWSAMTSMVISDLFKGKFARSTTRSMVITFIVVICCYLSANLFIDKILDKLILANIPLVSLSFALLAGFYWEKASKGGAYTSIITGITAGTAFYLIFGEEGSYTFYWSFIGIPLIFIMGVIGSYLFPERRKVMVFAR